jgi:hypothetical protein
MYFSKRGKDENRKEERRVFITIETILNNVSIYCRLVKIHVYVASAHAYSILLSSNDMDVGIAEV